MGVNPFNRSDSDVPGPPRDFVGYGETPPRLRWKDDCKVAVQMVVNMEEGSERSFPMGDQRNEDLHEFPFVLEGSRDLDVESIYEYGSRAGIWRLFRVLDSHDVPVTFFAAAVALERNPLIAEKIRRRGDEVAAHGYRWMNSFDMTREDEKKAMNLAVESITRTIGTRPLGWYSRQMSVHSRELIVEEGGFVYDAEAYNDDLPYWTRVKGKPHLVVPYTIIVNDVLYVLSPGFGNPNDFFEVARTSLDRLRNDGDDAGRMMSVGLHARYAGRPERADALARFIAYAQGFDDVCFMTRLDIARAFMEQVPPPEDS